MGFSKTLTEVAIRQGEFKMTEQLEKLVFQIPLDKLKRSRLLIPDELVETLGAIGREVTVLLIDEAEKKYVAIMDGDRKTLGEGSLGAWYRTHNPIPTESVRLEILDAEEKRLRITLSSARHVEDSGFHVGQRWNMVGGVKTERATPYYIQPADLLTHGFICGATGSGKTVLAKALLEEALLWDIPVVAIDLKGDLTSMGLVIDGEDPDILVPMQTGETEEDRKRLAFEALKTHLDRLRESGLDFVKARKIKEKLDLRVFTPRLARGIQLGFPAALGAPPDAKHLAQKNETYFKEYVRAVTDTFLERLYPKTSRAKIENERNFLFEIVDWSWRRDVDLCGINGLKDLLRLIIEPPFTTIGGLPVSQYIDAENRRNRLLNKVNTLISGPEVMWFEGEPLTADLLFRSKEEKVPLSIINLSELDQFEDRSFVVSQVTHTIFNWMRTQSGTDRPRVLLFIDEIGGGGGRAALFPSYPYHCAAKWGLNYLLRQGRAFGICCIFATQNPGDVDYKALSNCGIWAVGRLGTKRDRDKATESFALTGREQKWLRNFIARAEPGDFALRTPRGDIDYIHSRWTYGYHKVLSPQEVIRLANLVAQPQPEDTMVE